MLTEHIQNSVRNALAEDIGTGDITAALLPNTPITASILCREPAVLCGQAWVNEVFARLDPAISVTWHFKDGQSVPADAFVCDIMGPARPVLTGERTALNFLQTLSGTATTTHHLVKLIAHTPCKLLDTRKTLPGLRLAQKYAVKIGGGHNHRMGLYDAYLIKENHIAAAGGITPAIEMARKLHPHVFLEVEVETLDQLQEAITCRPDRIMLDNFSLDGIRQALTLPHEGIEIEVSGGISQNSLKPLAEMGVDCISLGTLTKALQPIDFSMRITPQK